MPCFYEMNRDAYFSVLARAAKAYRLEAENCGETERQQRDRAVNVKRARILEKVLWNTRYRGGLFIQVDDRVEKLLEGVDMNHF